MAEPKTVLLVEDDAEQRSALSDALSGAGYRVLEADRVAVALNLTRTRTPDLAVLDVELPDGTGLDVCRAIRAGKAAGALPVVMLTGKGGLGDKGAGFEAGADQYLVKPVAPSELLLWVGALLRRVRLDTGEADVLRAGDLVIDEKAHVVRLGDTVVSDLTVKEFELLRFLVKKRPQVLSRKYILANLWRTVAVDKAVDAHVFNLRRKLPPAAADRLQTVPGKGFRWL